MRKSKWTLVLLMLFSAFTLVNCSLLRKKTPDQSTGSTIAAQMGMDAFAPFGGYDAGSLIVFDGEYPTLFMDKAKFEELDKNKEKVEKSLPPSTYDIDNQFKLHLDVLAKRGTVSASTKNKLQKINSIKLDVIVKNLIV